MNVIKLILNHAQKEFRQDLSPILFLSVLTFVWTGFKLYSISKGVWTSLDQLFKSTFGSIVYKIYG